MKKLRSPKAFVIPVIAEIVGIVVMAQAPSAIPRILSESEDKVSKGQREARSRFYDALRNSSEKPLDAPSEPSAVKPPFPPPPPPASLVHVDLTPLPEMPIEMSDVVAVADITAAQPFLTWSHHGVYTEITAKILDSIKGELGSTDIIILRRGGRGHLEDGRIVSEDVSGEGDPMLVGKRYLLFLAYGKEQNAYFVHTMWRVENDVIRAAFPADVAKAAHSESQFDRQPLVDVLAILRLKLNNN